MYGTKENPLFLAKDVAEWIDYAKTGQGYYDISSMLTTVDSDEKIKTISTNNSRSSWFLTEDGLYEVLMQSRKPIAKAFKKEVKKILKINHGDSNARVLNKHIRSKILMKKTK
ncbi:Bro-N domain-containing protein [uncultured Clostridium sp.]|uniref:BRO-N domain-containing protein n=1 Tax=uncultured Clostridium sp. TaxID=59620 RepID=UPI0026088B4F|nr:Bro-N domain-containing protein [uncultured Clostridium sp.]